MILIPDYMDHLTYDDKTHTYRVSGRVVPHITGIVPSDYSHVPPSILERARLRGSEAHRVVEQYLKGTLDLTCINPEIEPFLESFIKAAQALEITVEADDVERMLYHPIDRYAGRGDLPRCYVEGELSTLELKTVARMDSNVDLQTAGQQRAENYRCNYLGLPPTVNRWGLQLTKDGSFSRQKNAKFYTSKFAEKAFVAKLISLNWDVLNGNASYTH